MCTIPECAVKRSTLDTARDALNDLIKEDSREGVYVYILTSSPPFSTFLSYFLSFFAWYVPAARICKRYSNIYVIDIYRYILDLNQKMPYHSLDPVARDNIWDDGLHFTEAGYERIGEMVARRLIGIIERGEGKNDVV